MSNGSWHTTTVLTVNEAVCGQHVGTKHEENHFVERDSRERARGNEGANGTKVWIVVLVAAGKAVGTTNSYLHYADSERWQVSRHVDVDTHLQDWENCLIRTTDYTQVSSVLAQDGGFPYFRPVIYAEHKVI